MSQKQQDRRKERGETPGRWERAQRFVNNAATRRVGRGVKAMYSTYRGSTKWRYRFLTFLVAVAVIAATVWAWDAGVFSGEPERVEEGRKVTTVTPGVSLTPQSDVPYAFRDSVGVLDMGMMAPQMPNRIDATLSFGPDGVPVGIEVNDVLFPDWRPSSAGITARVHCPEHIDAARCDSVSVTLTPAQRSLVEIDARPGIGMGVEPNFSRPGLPWDSPQIYAGADALRFGPFWAGAGITAANDSLGRLDVNPSVSIGTDYKRNVTLYCEDDPRAVFGSHALSPSCGARIAH